MASRFKQGIYIPVNPGKYVGDPTKIRYMSSWELELHKFFDNNTKVIRWASEEISIPYFNPVKNRPANYFPDYWVEYINKDGTIIREIIELKPLAQTRLPRAKVKVNLYEQLTAAVNFAKWSAAREWCKQRGLVFRIVTEKSVFK